MSALLGVEPVGAGREPLPALEGFEKAGRLCVAETLGDLLEFHIGTREQFLAQTLTDFIDELAERRALAP